MSVRIQLRRDTSANWTSTNPVLAQGEPGLETDTGKLKYGTGTTAWNSLNYAGAGAGGGAITNSDIATSAEISVAKLANGTARQLLQTSSTGTDVEWTSNIDIPGTLDVTGTATFDGNVAIAGQVSDHLNLASTKNYRINSVDVLSATSLGSSVVSSSLTSVGTLTTGTWQATAIADTYIGTISTAGKVANSATTATAANTASAIVARDASGNFSAGTITANLTGTASAIADGSVTNAKVASNAAIAGTKVSPDFGSQNILTTGSVGVNVSPTEKLHVGGNILATGNVTAYSDIQVKSNIEPLKDAMASVLRLRGVTFTRIDQEAEGRQIGLIAQEVEQVVPEVVKTHDDGMKSLAYQNLVALLIEAVKEQQEQINHLQARMERS